MRVLNYVQLGLLEPQEQEEYRWYLEKYFGEAGLFHVAMFYYQNFEPELITKYFKGFVSETMIPRTLDEFITDCQKAGIKLIWKGGE